MKRASTIFLQAVVVLIGLGALVFLLWEPHVEGRNTHATLFEIYFKDPFLAYVYTASIAFFAGLFQAFKVLGFVRNNQTFCPETVKASRAIKHCAMVLIGFVAGAAVIILATGDREDRPAGIFMCFLAVFGSVVTAAAAGIVEKIFQNAAELKSENDLTV